MDRPEQSALETSVDQRFLDLSRRSVDETDNVIYLLDADLQISYCNPAWDRFALENAGEKVVRDLVVGTDLRAFLPDSLQRFYDDVFAIARARRVLAFDYECSSPDLFRLFRMQVKWLPQYGGFAVVNALRVERDHLATAAVAYTPERFVYADSQGIITMCCHCRKTQRQGVENTWDWVPEHLKRMPLTVSHGLCPVCADYFYPSPDRHAPPG